MGTGWRQK